jgi:hypothetical protein
MMSCTASAAWSHPVLSLYCTEHGSSRGAVLLGRTTAVAMYRSGQFGRRCTVATCMSAGSSVMHEYALKIREPSCVPRAAKPSFIPVVHSPPGAMGYVAAPKLPSQEGRAPSHGTHGSIEAPLSGRQSLEPWDT